MNNNTDNLKQVLADIKKINTNSQNALERINQELVKLDIRYVAKEIKHDINIIKAVAKSSKKD